MAALFISESEREKKMRTIKVNINKEKANYIERLNYELNITKDVIQRIIESHGDDPEILNGKAFKHYQKQAAELQAEYELASQEITKEYLPEYLKPHKCSWNLPNNSTELTISILCDCPIPEIDEVSA